MLASVSTAPDIWIFPEQSILLGSALTIDIKKTNPTTTILADIFVNSYFIHLGNTSGGTRSGTAVFDEPILGVIRTVTKLNNTDDLLELPGTTYPSDGGAPRFAAQRVMIAYRSPMISLSQ